MVINVNDVILGNLWTISRIWWLMLMMLS